MKLIDVKTDNVTDYRETSLLLVFPNCEGKCEGCHNEYLKNNKSYIDVTVQNIVDLYNRLDTHHAIVMAGLEPFDSFDDVLSIIDAINSIHKSCNFVIYTGYTYDEYKDKFERRLLDIHLNREKNCNSLIVKVGRYDKNNHNPWYCKSLGVELINKTQYIIQYNKFGTIRETAEGEETKIWKKINLIYDSIW